MYSFRMSVGLCVFSLLISATIAAAAKPTFGLQDTIKGAFWVLQHELLQNDPLLIGRNFIEVLGQKVFIGSASLSGQSSLSLDDLTVNEAVGDAFGLLSMKKVTATINEVAIDAFIVNFGLRFTEISLTNTSISWRFVYNNTTKQLSSLNVLPQLGTISGRVAVDLGGRVFERNFSDKNAIEAVNNMLVKSSARFSSDLMKLINVALHFYTNSTPNQISAPSNKSA